MMSHSKMHLEQVMRELISRKLKDGTWNQKGKPMVYEHPCEREEENM